MRALRAALVSSALAGCGFPMPALLGGDAGGGNDSGSGSGALDGGTHDGQVAHDDGQVGHDGTPPACFGSGFYKVCLPPPTAMFPGDALLIDTTIGASSSCAADVTVPSDNSLCVVAFSQLVMTDGQAILATGPRPLVVIGATSISIGDGATIDVSTHTGGSATGAGYGTGDCNFPNADSTIGTGGPGGSFGTQGGSGGLSTNGGALWASAATLSLPTSLRGGCGGTAGVGGGGGSGGADQGKGGGVVALLSNGTVEVDGVLAAAGEGANGGSANGSAMFQGGGGGGTGGMILIATTQLSGNGIIAAPGGGGGQGAYYDSFLGENITGAAGADPGVQPGNDSIPDGAAGGSGHLGGAAGGNGDPLDGNSAPGANVSGVVASADGGGGGGGGGWILFTGGVNMLTFTGQISPPITGI